MESCLKSFGNKWKKTKPQKNWLAQTWNVNVLDECTINSKQLIAQYRGPGNFGLAKKHGRFGPLPQLEEFFLSKTERKNGPIFSGGQF